ncbi:hypothetical protein F2Q70_00013730 [Brassica cretica]|uniref:Uncharacterized protein n=1 Tax=Brassica cretica TaxID=69181 RepID=A0A8S9MD51_BRACR|nr:hypothetical protein F2Q70_00013730 [Brassica cretica]
MHTQDEHIGDNAYPYLKHVEGITYPMGCFEKVAMLCSAETGSPFPYALVD